jgi:hypothetical protein
LSTVVCQLARAPARIESRETNNPMANRVQGPAAAASRVAKRSAGNGIFTSMETRTTARPIGQMSGLRITPESARRTPPGRGLRNNSRQAIASAKEMMLVATVASRQHRADYRR